MLAYAQVAAAAFGWGLWSLFLRPAALDARWATAVVMLVVGLAATPTLFFSGARGPREGGPRRTSEYGWMLALGVSDAGNALLFFAAMAKTSIAIAVLSHYLAPVLVSAFAPLLLGTPRRRGAIWLSIVALGGLALVLEPWAMTGGHQASAPAFGALLGAGSAVFYATNVLLNKAMSKRFSSEETLVYHAYVSALLMAGLALGQHAPLPSWRGLAIVAGGTVFVGAGGGLSFLYGLRRMPAEHAGMLCFLEPLVAVLAAWIAFGEQPHAMAALGGVIVIAAGLLAIWEPRRPSTDEPAPSPSTAA